MLKKQVKFIFLSLFLVIIFSGWLVKAQVVQAGTEKDLRDQLKNAAKAGWGEGEPTAENSLSGIIQTAVSAFLGLLGIIFLVLIIYSGFSWLTAGGDEEKVTLAKNTLSRAVIGLIIILAAYSITYFVFSSLSGVGSGDSGFGK